MPSILLERGTAIANIFLVTVNIPTILHNVGRAAAPACLADCVVRIVTEQENQFI